jgi:hypothetical protein
LRRRWKRGAWSGELGAAVSHGLWELGSAVAGRSASRRRSQTGDRAAEQRVGW